MCYSFVAKTASFEVVSISRGRSKNSKFCPCSGGSNEANYSFELGRWLDSWSNLIARNCFLKSNEHCNHNKEGYGVKRFLMLLKRVLYSREKKNHFVIPATNNEIKISKAMIHFFAKLLGLRITASQLD